MPSHAVAQLFAQQVSMPLPMSAPFGCFTSHAEMHAATGSPFAEVVVFVFAALPEEDVDGGVPVEP